MSKVPGRPYCSNCKKRSHGEHCKKGDCSCKCRGMTPEEIKQYFSHYHEEERYTYSKEEDENFEKFMEQWREIKDSKNNNIQEVTPQ